MTRVDPAGQIFWSPYIPVHGWKASPALVNRPTALPITIPPMARLHERNNHQDQGMGQLLFAIFFLALFVVAPIKVAAIFTGALFLATFVVQATTASISSVNVSLTESFKAIVYATFFSAVAVFTVFSFMVGAPRELFANSAAFAAASMPLIALQYGSFVLGFKMALGLTWLHAAIVAVASTAITSGAIWFITRMATFQT